MLCTEPRHHMIHIQSNLPQVGEVFPIATLRVHLLYNQSLQAKVMKPGKVEACFSSLLSVHH